jgi:hypothetical protein
MSEDPRKLSPIDYRAPDPAVERKWRRILMCAGMTVAGFGIGTIAPQDTLVKGLIVAAGAFMVGLVLPVAD